jgi:hypothetical protein
MSEKLDQIKRTLRRWFAPGVTRLLDFAKFRELAKGIVTTRPDEVDCGECFERLDRFAEMIKAGKSPTRAMPLVQDHIERCPDCKQEFVALMTALKADSGGKVPQTVAPLPMS